MGGFEFCFYMEQSIHAVQVYWYSSRVLASRATLWFYCTYTTGNSLIKPKTWDIVKFYCRKGRRCLSVYKWQICAVIQPILTYSYNLVVSNYGSSILNKLLNGTLWSKHKNLHVNYSVYDLISCPNAILSTLVLKSCYSAEVPSLIYFYYLLLFAIYLLVLAKDRHFGDFGHFFVLFCRSGGQTCNRPTSSIFARNIFLV